MKSTRKPFSAIRVTKLIRHGSRKRTTFSFRSTNSVRIMPRSHALTAAADEFIVKSSMNTRSTPISCSGIESFANKSQSIQFTVINDQHRSKKYYKYSKQCAILSILLMIGIILLSIFIVLFLKTNKTPLQAVLRWNSSGITIAGTGTFGCTSEQLKEPWDLFLDFSNSLYVTDRFNHRVQKFMMNMKNASTIAGRSNCTSGKDAGALYEPTGIYVDEDENLYVAVRTTSRLQYWATNASEGVTLVGNNGSGTATNQLLRPYGLDYDLETHTLYVADSDNNRVMSYKDNTSIGNIIIDRNILGLNGSELFKPCGMFLDRVSNSLYIANFANHNIIRWKRGESQASFIIGHANQTSGNSSSLLNEPTDITLDPMGNMYVTDRQNQRVQFFPIGMSEAVTIAGVVGIRGQNDTYFNEPSSLLLDNQLNLYVIDRKNHRVQKFLRY